MPEKRLAKVMKLEIVKPADGMSWKDLSKALRDVRYRVFRLANMVLSESYLQYHRKRSGDSSLKLTSVSKLAGESNKRLREMFIKEEKCTAEDLDMYSANGVLPATVTDALSRYKLAAVTSRTKWSDVTRGKCALPTFRLDMSIPVRCDKPGQPRLARTVNGDVTVELAIRHKPWPAVILGTGGRSLSDGHRAVLERLLDNRVNGESGYRQRCFEVKHEERSRKWFLYITYDFPASVTERDRKRIVGVDVGFSCPLYVAINNGHARLGWRHFAATGHRIRGIQSRTIARRRDMQRGGREVTSGDTARSGHGRKRKLAAIEKLQNKIGNAYTTLNHNMSGAVVKFALDNGAGVIQMENLEGLRETLTGTFLGGRWRYEELQRFITYKAEEAGIEVRKVKAEYTSRRCSKCGHIKMDFTRKFRDEERKGGKAVRFQCGECGHEADADYNAALNLATESIDDIIAGQLRKQESK